MNKNSNDFNEWNQKRTVNMNEKEIAEIRRRFRPDKSNITHVRGCYVNDKREIVSEFDQSLALMPQEEGEKILTPAMINNYVKLKLIPKPDKKKYGREHLAYLVAITILKQVLTISEVKQGIEYQAGINGLKEAFNLFCEEQEAAIKAVADHLKNQDSTFLLEGITVQNTAIKMATMSFAGKLVAEKILHLQNSYTARL